MSPTVISPEEQLRNVAKALLSVASDPARRSHLRREDLSTAVESLAEMVRRFLDDELKPIDIDDTEDS